LALVALPAGPADTVRGALVMRSLVPNLQLRAKRLGAELRALAALRADIGAERERLRSNAETLAEERRRLAELIRDKRLLERVARRESWSEQARAAELAAKARTVRELVDRLTATRGNLRRTDMAAAPAPASGRRSAEEAPAFNVSTALPASGRIVRRFGAGGGGPARAEGITIATRPAAHVVAPRGGRVVFAGPFRGYGRLLIIEHDEGYHVLLAGLGRIDAAVGDEVLAGEPVGAMTTSSNGTPNLYLELRRSGQPINPANRSTHCRGSRQADQR
jgi:septal ring factor EnvC (AmiA/AmiB activator)